MSLVSVYSTSCVTYTIYVYINYLYTALDRSRGHYGVQFPRISRHSPNANGEVASPAQQLPEMPYTELFEMIVGILTTCHTQ